LEQASQNQVYTGMTEPAETLAKSITHHTTNETALRQLRRLPVFAVPQEAND
jgi:hypothetical protein